MSAAIQTIKHDGSIVIAVGRSRKETNWKNRETRWSDMVKRFSQTKRTPETFAEYMTLPKEKQDEIKDVGGFVGGAVKDGKRKAGNVAFRQLLSLDADFVASDIWLDYTLQFTAAAILHSTHKHEPKKPRFRLLLPLSRPVNAEEYQAVSRYVADKVGIDHFDKTTFEFERLMYFPSTSIDAEYVFEVQDGAFLDVDSVLAAYDDWRNPLTWAYSKQEKNERQKQADKLGDPLEKDGIVGAFCRTYSIHEAIESFLSDVYVPSDMPNRYTYTEGTTAGGLVVYDDKFAYSHHATDPISGRTVNAFDLVRLHKFGAQDEDAEAGTAVTRLPSFKQMIDFAREDQNIVKTIAKETFSEAADRWKEVSEAEETGEGIKFDVDRAGKRMPTFNNFYQILNRDPLFQNRIAYNAFSHRKTLVGNLPWRTIEDGGASWTDRDDAELRGHMETVYQIAAPNKLHDALEATAGRKAFHPVREYLNGLEWDGIERVERLLIEYQGADDNDYIKAVTRKMMSAAVARVMKPGIKFDHMVVLVGEQGTGKSTLFQRLAGDWFSDSLTSVQGKDAFEQIQGVWIVEMGELSATKKADVEAIKHFLSKNEDSFRVAYGRQTSSFPRQCIFVGTTNDREFLRDKTGNRRFWVVPTNKDQITKNLFRDLNRHEVGQLWAEAVEIWKAGETLFLDRDLSEFAEAMQETFSEESPLVGTIAEYLERWIPERWDQMDLFERRQYLRDPLSEVGTVRRDKVCSVEIWCECMGGELTNFPSFRAREINESMRKISEWQRSGSKTGMLRFPIYGKQRAYIRNYTNI
jgi:putative DNA primase/helicase